MGIAEILASLDKEIQMLKQARALLAGMSSDGTSGAANKAAPAKRKSRKRRLSPEGRRKIAEAVRRRWEQHRKAAAGKKK